MKNQKKDRSNMKQKRAGYLTEKWGFQGSEEGTGRAEGTPGGGGVPLGLLGSDCNGSAVPLGIVGWVLACDSKRQKEL